MPGLKSIAVPHGGSSARHAAAAPAHIGATLFQRISDFATAFSHWVTGNIIGIVIAAAVGTGLALAMLAIRSLGCKLIAKLGTDPHWPVIFARVLAKTKVYFIILLSAELVADHADTPPVVMGLIHALLVVAVAMQDAV